MRLISVNRCQPGEKLAKTIYTSNGTVLIGAGVALSQKMLDRLKELNITSIYIEDKLISDVVVSDAVSEETRREAMATITTVFQSFRSEPGRWRQLFVHHDVGRKFRQVMGSVIDELKQNRSALNLLGSVCGMDHYIFSHSFHVALYTTSLGMKLGLSDRELIEVGMGAMLHDVGKMAIPAELLMKPGKLTEEEYELVKKHTEFGFELLRKQEELSLLTAHCAYQHHERCDGSGYPRQLTEKEIHPYAKMIAVCDVFDALTTSRSYRSAVLPHVAMEVLFAGVDKLFVKEIVEAFYDTIALYPIGLTVRLTNGEEGVVVDYNRGAPSRPIIRILKNPKGEAVAAPYEIDLSKRLDVMIASCDLLV
ncbi:HD-GYP domain-containing protein [Brevibacillus humidisoli]|uniref:HD-GYP domain-containing protein n=1 Tax=Brevibacillus humidisoli TaxID=2895522 RepID=UPI001E4D0C11|nr:HD-GYP domain-containing protein [Brevibacillus humidisoli]UFJ39708.1 HD-GYP domain-containing protein [Brevibacillus humidisoli]